MLTTVIFSKIFEQDEGPSDNSNGQFKSLHARVLLLKFFHFVSEISI